MKAKSTSHQAVWRKNNPDKVRAQRERANARRRGELAPFAPKQISEEEKKRRSREKYLRSRERIKQRKENDPEYKKSENAASKARSQKWYEKLRANPEAHAQWLKEKRDKKRIQKGIPLDKPVKPQRLTDEERIKRQKEQQQRSKEKRRNKYRLAHGIPLDAPLRTVSAPRVKKIDQERARRAAEIQKAKSLKLAQPKPLICPDPPELQALFRKASKGDPVQPYDPTAKRITGILAKQRWV